MIGQLAFEEKTSCLLSVKKVCNESKEKCCIKIYVFHLTGE